MTTTEKSAHPDDTPIIADTRHWLEKAVIGLNLCPFAKAVYVKEQVRYVVCHAQDDDAILQTLHDELEVLAEANPEKIDTTLLILPDAYADFLDFNDFLEAADAVLDALELVGFLQIASFHPRFQFADTEPNAISNYTNRAPYPILHLLREDSIDRAVESFPEAEMIFEKNIETLETLGEAGWKALGIKNV